MSSLRPQLPILAAQYLTRPSTELHNIGIMETAESREAWFAYDGFAYKPTSQDGCPSHIMVSIEPRPSKYKTDKLLLRIVPIGSTFQMGVSLFLPGAGPGGSTALQPCSLQAAARQCRASFSARSTVRECYY